MTNTNKTCSREVKVLSDVVVIRPGNGEEETNHRLTQIDAQIFADKKSVLPVKMI